MMEGTSRAESHFERGGEVKQGLCVRACHVYLSDDGMYLQFPRGM